MKETGNLPNTQTSGRKRKRQLLSPEKKFQIFFETQSGKKPIGDISRLIVPLFVPAG